MGLRDLLVIFVFSVALAATVRRPPVGVLLWSWLAYMNPHRLTWGWAYDLPLSQICAIVLLLALPFWRELRSVPLTGLTVTWATLLVWMSVTTALALFPEDAWEQAVKVLKIQVLTVITIMVMRTRSRIEQLVWVITLSIGLFTVKGGIFALVTNFQWRVWGPPESFLTENNTLAVAALMILPMMWYLRKWSESAWLRHGLTAGMILTPLSVIASYSRGALVTSLAILAFLATRGRRAMAAFAAVLVIAAAVVPLLPEKWFSRMETIENYEQDGSAMARLGVWQMAITIAEDRWQGAGFNPWRAELVARYGNENTHPKGHSAHSIYFSMLAEHGWIGLGLFLSLLALTWRTAGSLRQGTSDVAQLQWLGDLGQAIQVSLVAFMVGGAFLSIAYFDLFWHLVAAVVILRAVRDEALTVSRSGNENSTPIAVFEVTKNT